ncbi:MAG: hypothetical protein OHK0045_15950 [Raineya sp.]
MKSFLFFIAFFVYACSSPQEQSNHTNGKTQETSTAVSTDYLEKGENITTATQTSLLQAVSKAIAEKEPHGAVEYCNLKALSIVDSLSKVHNCQIRRVSDKYRNPQDKAQNQVEEKALQTFLEKHQKQEKLEPFTLQEGKNTYYFKPIMVGMETCLKCHGDKNKDIAPQTLAVIEKLYPTDLAKGYKLKDFRGMWVVKFMQ